MFWKRFFSVIIMLVTSSVLACLLYPWIQTALTNWTDLDYPPARVFRRIWMIAVILGLIVCRKWLGMRHPGKTGYPINKNSLQNLGIGITGVFAFLSGLSLLYLVFGTWQFSDPFPLAKFPKRLYQGLIRGILVSGLEEYIFRGLLFFSLCRTWKWQKAAIVTSLIFASLHFLEGRGVETITDAVSWYSGFQICWMLLSNMASEFTFFPDAVGLFIVGMALCHAAHHTGSLWYGAGLHGGWVWFFTFRGSLFLNSPEISSLWFGGNRLYNGIIPMLGMLLIFPVTVWLVKRNILRRKTN